MFNKVRIRCRSKGLSITFFFKIRMLCSVKKIVNVKFLNFIKNDSDQLRTKNFTIFLFEIVKPKSCVTEFMNDALRERCLDFLFCFEKKVHGNPLFGLVSLMAASADSGKFFF